MINYNANELVIKYGMCIVEGNFFYVRYLFSRLCKFDKNNVRKSAEFWIKPLLV